MQTFTHLREDRKTILAEISRLQHQISLIDALLGEPTLISQNHKEQAKETLEKEGNMRKKKKIARRRLRTKFNSPEHNPNRLMATPGFLTREFLKTLAAHQQEPMTSMEISKLVNWKATGSRTSSIEQSANSALRYLFKKNWVNKHSPLSGKRGSRFVLNDKGLLALGEMAKKFQKEKQE
jgi:hypothetical protein